MSLFCEIQLLELVLSIYLFWMPSVDSRGFIWLTIICDFGFLNPRLFYLFSHEQVKIPNKALYVSLPTPGIWFLRASDSSCQNGTIPLDSEITGAGLNVTLTGCPGNCGEENGRGSCKTYFTEGAVLISTCKCKAG